MARFTDEELTRIKQDISLIRIMEAEKGRDSGFSSNT